MESKSISNFFKEFEDVIRKLNIPKKDFESIFKILSESETSTKTFGDIGELIQNIPLSKPFETILLICFSSLENLFTANLNKEIDERLDEELFNISNREVHLILFKLFFILRSPISENRQTSLTIFTVLLTIIGFSNICDKSELVKFTSNVFKQNDIDMQEILMNMFRSLYFLTNKENDILNSKQGNNRYH